jgi:hypothetical protein
MNSKMDFFECKEQKSIKLCIDSIFRFAAADRRKMWALVQKVLPDTHITSKNNNVKTYWL